MRLVLVLLATLVGLVAAELLARVANPDARQLFVVQSRRESERGKFCRYDPTLGWAGIPNADDDFDYVDARHHVHQNGYGFRGREIPLARSTSRRLAVLGDSFVWGFGVEEAQIFTELIARDAPSLDVVNLGVSGYGTDQELLLWREQGIRFHPDVVLLVATPYTDAFDVLYDERYGYAKPRFRLEADGRLVLENVPVPTRRDRGWNSEPTVVPQVPHLPLLETVSRSALLSTALAALTRAPSLRERMERAGWLPERLLGSNWEDLLFGQPIDRLTVAGFTLMGNVMATLAAEVRASGAEIVVAIVPTPVQVYPAMQDGFRTQHGAPADRTWDFETPRHMMDEVCRVVGVRCVDLLPDLQEAGRSDPYLYYRWNLHWTAAGHRVVATTIERALRAP